MTCLAASHSAHAYASSSSQGNMAVCNVLGSNVFNILLGLGCPWMIASLLHDGEPFRTGSNSIIEPTIILFGYLVRHHSCYALRPCTSACAHAAPTPNLSSPPSNYVDTGCATANCTRIRVQFSRTCGPFSLATTFTET